MTTRMSGGRWIWLALPADPTQRVELARIPHREGFGIKPSLSPDGRKLAYLSLPATARSAQSSEAEAFVMDLETKETEKIAEDVDLTFAPLWSPDGSELFYRGPRGMMAVPVDTEPTFSAGDPEVLFEQQYHFFGYIRVSQMA